MASSIGYSSGEALGVLADRGYITTPRVIRNIEDKLALPIRRDAQHQRVYTEVDIEQLANVIALQEAGLSLPTIYRVLIERDIDVLTFQSQRLDHAMSILQSLKQTASNAQAVGAERQ